MLDYVLAGLAGMMATYSVGMSLGRPQMGLFFVVFIALGMAASFYVQKIFSGRKWVELGGFVYFLLAVSAVFYARHLNAFLPEGGFAERELTVAAVLSWMILLGSWVAWKDSTLLFQAVPSIALFGLVGAFNTFQGSTIAFFAFLLCLATLFARAHARSMLKQALDSGFTRLETIRQGPWRWMAGPEWALASSAVVILISVLGAPVLRASVKDISGVVRFPLPNLNRSASQPPVQLPGSINSTSNAAYVGTGPIRLSDRVVFQASLDRERYLRTDSLSTYQRGSWIKVPLERNAAQIAYDQTMADRRELVQGENFEVVPFAIQFEGLGMQSLPAPGEVVQMDRPDLFQLLLDGGLGITRMVPPNSSFKGRTAVHKPGSDPRNVPMPVPEFLWKYLATNDTPLPILELADQVTLNAKTDYEKALAIKAEIERRCKYNLKAEQNPAGTDPVEYFLFGERNEGYCDLFASAMVLMARGAGIPARYTRGYLPLRGDEDHDGWYPITESSAHAWAELYFDGFGWVVFDPTEGAAFVPGGERGAFDDGKAWYQREWFMWTLNLAIAFGVLGAGLVAFRGAKQARAQVDWNQVELARQYETFAAALQKASGQPRRPSQTATEYLHLVDPKLGGARAEAHNLNSLFIQALYAPPKEGRITAADLKEPVKNFRRSLKQALRNV